MDKKKADEMVNGEIPDDYPCDTCDLLQDGISFVWCDKCGWTGCESCMEDGCWCDDQ